MTKIITTSEYINSLDRETRFKEMDRLYITEPTIAFLNSIPSEYKNSEFAKFYIERAILDEYNIVHFSNNFDAILDGQWDFIYDQSTGYIFVSLGSAHAILMSRIAALRLCIDSQKFDFKSITSELEAFSLAVKIMTAEEHTPMRETKLSEKYLLEGYGVFMSSMSSKVGKKKISLSRNFKMTPQEKIVFKDYKFDYID
jgi:hypothetical protein